MNLVMQQLGALGRTLGHNSAISLKLFAAIAQLICHVHSFFQPPKELKYKETSEHLCHVMFDKNIITSRAWYATICCINYVTICCINYVRFPVPCFVWLAGCLLCLFQTSCLFVVPGRANIRYILLCLSPVVSLSWYYLMKPPFWESDKIWYHLIIWYIGDDCLAKIIELSKFLEHV